LAKVQVYDRKTEQEEITGAPSDSDEKEMNLQLKDEFKKGGFGKVIVGYGDQNRVEVKGNYNRFNDKHQFSVVGVGNNTGRNGLGWDDYQDFMGSNAYNFDDYDLRYGFSSRGGFYTISFGSGGNPLENKIQAAFFSGQQTGFPTDINGGLNYNYDDSKTKVGASYFFNRNNNLQNTESVTETYYDDFSTSSSGYSDAADQMTGNRAEFSVSSKIDSFHFLRFTSNLAYVISGNEYDSYNLSLNDEYQKITESTTFNNTHFDGYLTKNTLKFRKTFRKKGRYLGANMTYLYTEVDDEYNTLSTLDFYGEEGVVDSSQIIDQQRLSLSEKSGVEANFMYAEPLSLKFFLTFFYNMNSTLQKGDVDVFDVDSGSDIRNDYLSRLYENRVFYQRGGSTLRYTHEGLNITLGGAYKNMRLIGEYTGKGNSSYDGEVDDSFNNWLPYLSIRYSVNRSLRFGASYSRTVNEPGIESLLPIVDTKNPLYITEGNPELSPEVSNQIRMNISYSVPVTGFNLYLNGAINLHEQQIIQDQTVDANLITYTKPINYEGGKRYNTYTGVHFPIFGKKLKAQINFSGILQESYSIVNSVLNETSTLSLYPSLYLNVEPDEFINSSVSYRYGQSLTRYNISTSQDQNILNHTIGVDLNIKMGKGWEVESKYDHSFYFNDRFGDDESIPIINLSLSKKMLKNNRGLIRLSVYDLLDRSRSFRQFSGSNQISQSITTNLSRYFMLSFTYDLKGAKSSTPGAINIVK
jgi:outer membrane receptor protein involved in Fe transport